MMRSKTGQLSAHKCWPSKTSLHRRARALDEELGESLALLLYDEQSGSAPRPEIGFREVL